MENGTSASSKLKVLTIIRKCDITAICNEYVDVDGMNVKKLTRLTNNILYQIRTEIIRLQWTLYF